MTVKSLNTLYGSKEYNVTNSVIQDSDNYVSFPLPSLLNRLDTIQVWCEFFCDTTIRINSAKCDIYVAKKDSILPDNLIIKDVNANVFGKLNNNELGTLYRGWGAFAYNAGEGRFEQPINITENSYTKYSNEYNIKNYDSDTTNDIRLDYRSLPYFSLNINPEFSNKWIGPNDIFFITENRLRSCRLFKQNINTINPLELSSYNASSTSNIKSAPGYPIIMSNSSGNKLADMIVFSESTASANGTIELSTMDMNGDGYPDIITQNNVQYSTNSGALSELITPFNAPVQRSEASSVSYGSGGYPVPAVSIPSSGGQSAGNSRASAISESNSKTYNLNISGDYGISINNDVTTSSFIDINGDGLPDILSETKDSKTKYIKLNLGYRFTDSIDFDYGTISDAHSTSANIGLGLGFDFAAGTLTGGVGAVKTSTINLTSFIDINGDGLVDKITATDDNTLVWLNRGNMFDSQPIVWSESNRLNYSESTSTSINTAVSAYIPLPLLFTKIIITPSFSIGSGFNTSQFDIRDMDGDGFVDILASSSEESLSIWKSTIARTNKLKTVTNSLGGKFHIDYNHNTPTINHPGGKWVMSSVVIDDGISDDGANPRMDFEYGNGVYDRREREFLGFGTVTISDIDTDNSNSVYRSTVHRYDVSNYYVQGNLLSTEIKDAEGNLFSKESHEYYSYSARATNNNYTIQNIVPSDGVISYTPLRYTKQEMYEGGNSGVIMSESWYGYKIGNGSFGELITYKYSDKGNLGNNGSGTYDYQTTIEYFDTVNDDKYIWGLPNLVTVNSNGNILLRKSSATYNTTGEILSLTQHLNNGSAITNFDYDPHGNITKRTLPSNNKGQRMCYTYTYETDMGMYITYITDTLDYESKLQSYDYRYGIPLKHIDINGQETTYTIDNLGRITSVLSPIDKSDVEIDGYSPYTIKFEYANAQINDNGEISQPARALTYHFNKFTDDTEDYDIMTVAFCDGFGRNIQVQKEAIVGNTQGQSTHSMIVSGRTRYDAFGRIIESYYPTTVNYNGSFDFCSTFDNITPTISVYDILDRTIQNILPDNTITSYNYNIDPSTQSIVTTITDANDNISKTYTNGSGKTIKTEQFITQNSPIPTTFEYDAIGQLVKVTDAEGNITTSTYDMGGRVTQVVHTASGTTTYAYDNLGNVIAKRTSNMTIGNAINYNYHFTRLSSVEYPNNPENNISLLYGNNNENNSIGRVLIKTDGSGATEYKYDKLGNITYERRSVVVPNNGIYTFVTQYSYDSFNRLHNMTYPDGEIVTYNYDAGGNVSSVTHNNEAGESNYVDQILYDKFNNRTYMKYGNGIISTYSYDPLRCRLSNMTAGNFINKSYEYDAVSNILSITNDTSAGGDMNHSYSYDNLYRLKSANGVYSGANNKTASYNLTIEYDNMHRITSKQQFLTQENVQFDGTLYAGYNMSYTYDDNKKFQLSSVSDNNYRSVSNPVDSVYNTHTYQYDANGNLTYVATGRKMKDGHTEDLISERKLLWDDENRIMAISDNGYVSTYRYDDAGNRTVKLSGHGEAVFVNGSESGSIFTQTNRFTAYPNPYMVYNGSRYYKHIYVGSERIVSKVSVNNSDYDPRQENCAGNSLTGYTVKLQSQQQALSDSIASIYAKFEVPYYPNNNDDYDYNWNDGLRRSVSNPDSYGELAYFYHSDHLGSTSYVTDANGEVSQHVEYVPFGEVFIEELSSSAKLNTPFLFNGKELDEETGLYYYGARYYDPRTSLWLSTDPMELKYPNVSTYAYCLNNPVKLIDVFGYEPTEEEAARMADYVYGNGNVILTGGWIESKNNYGISMDHSRSGFKSQLFERTIDGVTEYTYAFAGTDLTSIKDWGNNIVQLIGMSKQYSIAMNNAEVLVRELKNQELTFVGHSLGGGLAAASAYAIEGRAMTFNAAGVSPLTINKTSRARIDAYITINDELHLFQSTMRLHTADGTKHWRIGISNLLGHSIENFYKPNLFKQARSWLYEKYLNLNNNVNSILKP